MLDAESPSVAGEVYSLCRSVINGADDVESSDLISGLD
jgi:hypothetical protein